jgi:hypothetical protein
MFKEAKKRGEEWNRTGINNEISKGGKKRKEKAAQCFVTHEFVNSRYHWKIRDERAVSVFGVTWIGP